jgi:hypothetical protein
MILYVIGFFVFLILLFSWSLSDDDIKEIDNRFNKNKKNV